MDRENHLNSTRLNICTHLGLKPFHPGHFRKVNHLQLIRVLFASSTMWKGLSQTSRNQGWLQGRWHMNWLKGNLWHFMCLSCPQFHSEPHGHSSSLEVLCLGLCHVTLSAGLVTLSACHLPHLCLDPPVLPSSVSQGTDPCKLWHSCFLSNRIVVRVSWEAPSGDWMMGAGKKLKYLYRPPLWTLSLAVAKVPSPTRYLHHGSSSCQVALAPGHK